MFITLILSDNDLICQLDRGDEIQDDRAYQPKFLLLDHLGTTRAELKFVEDDDTGDITPTIASGYDYMPYGELIAEDHLIESLPGNPDPRTEQVLFTGKPRDKESGLDYFGERFKDDFRFNSPDQPFADVQIWNPQSWNLYLYVRNNPTNNFDPNGLGTVSASVKFARKVLSKRLFKAARKKAVRQAWAQEKRLLKETGRTTMKLSVKERKELLKRGKVTGWQGHHINNVAANDLEMAMNPNNIKFVKGRKAHFVDEHGSNWTNETSGDLIDRLANLGGPALLTFFLVYDQKLREITNDSPLVSDPDSFWSNINPYNYIVDNIALLEALVAAEKAMEEEKQKDIQQQDQPQDTEQQEE